MTNAAHLPFSAGNYQLKFYHSISDAPESDWLAVTGGSDIFKSKAYLAACEASQFPGMEFLYGIAYANRQPSAVFIFQLSNLSDPGLGGVLNLHDYGFFAGAVVTRMNRFLFEPAVGSTHILCCGNLLLSGDHGIAAVSEAVFADVIRFLPEVFNWITGMIEAPRKVVAWMIKDFEPAYDTIAQPLLHPSFFRLHTDPVMTLKLDPSWKTFDDYLEALSSKYRIRANASLAKIKDLKIKELDLTEIHAQEASITMLLEQVLSKAPVKLVRPVSRYFQHLKQNLGDGYVLYGYYLHDQLVAFTSGIRDQGHFEAHYIGLDYERNKEFSLYQNILYGYVKEAIEWQSGCYVHFGRTALEIKSTLGARPFDVGCYLRLNHKLVHSLAKPLMSQAGPGTWVPRNPFRNGNG